MGGVNTKRLAAVLSDRMKQTSSAAVGISVELGTYNGDQSITPDSLRARIPKGQYMINFSLVGSVTTEPQGDGDGGSHAHRLPARFDPLKQGDRILIAWCGTEPVVIAKVISS